MRVISEDLLSYQHPMPRQPICKLRVIGSNRSRKLSDDEGKTQPGLYLESIVDDARWNQRRILPIQGMAFEFWKQITINDSGMIVAVQLLDFDIAFPLFRLNNIFHRLSIGQGRSVFDCLLIRGITNSGSA